MPQYYAPGLEKWGEDLMTILENRVGDEEFMGWMEKVVCPAVLRLMEGGKINTEWLDM